MAKRLSREQKTKQAVIDLINEMFIIAGHEVNYDSVKNRKDAWYQEWTMTTQQYEDWKVWGKKYLMKKLNLGAKAAEREMIWVGLMWGLKCRNVEDYIKNNDTTGV
jgi:hypothetical protein